MAKTKHIDEDVADIKCPNCKENLVVDLSTEDLQYDSVFVECCTCACDFEVLIEKKYTFSIYPKMQ